MADLQRQVSSYVQQQQQQEQQEWGVSSGDIRSILDTASQAKGRSPHRSTNSSGAYNANMSGVQEEDVMLEMDVLRCRVKDLEEEITARLNQSKAVTQMRRLLREKNGIVSELRRRLFKYEPEMLQAHGGDASDF